MTTSFVRRGIALYRAMDEETKIVYRNILGLHGSSKVIDIENALAKFEIMRTNFNEMIIDMEADIEYLKTNK